VTITQAINKAQGGGYKFSFVAQYWRDDKMHPIHPHEYPLNGILLDPAFWQALGKAMWWDWWDENNSSLATSPVWRLEWHHFIDYLADGKTAEGFFEQLT
jgi:hypothetical protein